MRYFRVFGYKRNEVLIECTPYNIANYPLGDMGKFNTIEDAEYAISTASHFHHPRFQNAAQYSKAELLQLGIEFSILQFYSPEDNLQNKKANEETRNEPRVISSGPGGVFIG